MVDYFDGIIIVSRIYHSVSLTSFHVCFLAQNRVVVFQIIRWFRKRESVVSWTNDKLSRLKLSLNCISVRNNFLREDILGEGLKNIYPNEEFTNVINKWRASYSRNRAIYSRLFARSKSSTRKRIARLFPFSLTYFFLFFFSYVRRSSETFIRSRRVFRKFRRTRSMVGRDQTASKTETFSVPVLEAGISHSRKIPQILAYASDPGSDTRVSGKTRYGRSNKEHIVVGNRAKLRRAEESRHAF